MKKSLSLKCIRFLCAFALTGITSICWGLVDCTTDKNTGFDIFLLAGQSNMVGVGEIPDPIDADGAQDAAIKMLGRTGDIIPAQDPIIHSVSSKGKGVGLGMSFAKAYLYWLKMDGQPCRKVLLVGAAWGGTGFGEDLREGHENDLPHRWMVTENEAVGGDLYRKALDRANLGVAAAIAAEPTSRFKGILWHQGEFDIARISAAEYAVNHSTLMKALRTSIKDPKGNQVALTAPIVVGEMTPCYLARCLSKWQVHIPKENVTTVLNYFHQIEDYLPRSAWVSSAGLGPDRDIHFDTASQRELGRRYFSKYWEAVHSLPAPDVDIKSYDGKFFNVGKSIDFNEIAYPFPRKEGNVYIGGDVTAVNDPKLGNVARVNKDTGSISLLINGETLNHDYTKMAWVKINGKGNLNHIISAMNPGQAHYLYVPKGFLAAGHSNFKSATNNYVNSVNEVPLKTWVHVAVVYKEDIKKMFLLLNGELIDTAKGVEPATPTSGNIELGIPSWGGRPGYGLDGEINSAKIYNKAFSSERIKAVYDFERQFAAGYGLR